MSTTTPEPAPPTAVVVPCYNEENRLDTERFLEFASQHPEVRFVLVDDGSRDRTRDLLERLAAADPEHFEVLALEQNSGKAEAVRRGVLYALDSEHDDAFVGFWDADLATPLDAIPQLRSAFALDPDLEIVLGARVKMLGRQIERRAVRHLLGRAFASAVSLALSLPVYDSQCGAKLFRVTADLREIFAEPFHSTWIFDVELLARYRNRRGPRTAAGLAEFPLHRWRDVAGSKVQPTDFVKAARELLAITVRYRLARHSEA